MSDFTLITSLSDRDAVNPLPDREVEGGPLFAGRSVASFEIDRSRLGSDHCTIYPANLAGEWCWLLHRCWVAGRGYSASGEIDEILDFESGIRLMVENGVFSGLFPGMEPEDV